MTRAPEGGYPAYTVDFRGPEGLAALSTHGQVFLAKDPATFRSQLQSIPLGGTRIINQRSTAHRGEWSREMIEVLGADVVFFYFILTGTIVGHQDGRAMRQRDGGVHLLRSSADFHYVASTPIHAVSLWIERSALRPDAARAARHVTTLEFNGDIAAVGASAILRAIVRRPPEPQSAEARALESALVRLVEAVLISADLERRAPESAGLFPRIRAWIETAPPEFTAAQIAEALGVELADVHIAIAAQGTSVGELTREARLDRLERWLHDPAEQRSILELSLAAGFGGSTQAARSFRERFGMSMGQYRTLARLQ